MDTSTGKLSSGTIRLAKDKTGEDRPDILVFSNVGPKNILRSLDRDCKVQLLAIIKWYVRLRDDPPPEIEVMERLSRLANDAEKLAGKMKNDLAALAKMLDDEDLGDSFNNRISELGDFAMWLKGLTWSGGKSGHKRRVLSKIPLVSISEFICMKVGSYRDEDFAELMQGQSDLSLDEELSGDAIRKTRHRLQKEYPYLYHLALETAKTLHVNPDLPDGRRAFEVLE